MARLSEVLGRRGSLESQLSALGAISSAASAAGSGFQPYAAAVLPLLRSYMNITEVSSHANLQPIGHSLLRCVLADGLEVADLMFVAACRKRCCRVGREPLKRWASLRALLGRMQWEGLSRTLWVPPYRYDMSFQLLLHVHILNTIMTCSGLKVYLHLHCCTGHGAGSH